MANRLADETSPYLLQHANNPVDWYPWGEEALARARAENKPIFLSIGYSACHWCHVMERESFEDPATAEVMNEHFVSIKVDREERPDLDTIYMKAVVALTGRGGWPMSVWLTPELAPFFGGTYFPDTPRGGMPSFVQVLDALASAWTEKPAEIARSAQQLAGHLRDELGPLGADEDAAPAGPGAPDAGSGTDAGPLADVIRLPVGGLNAEALGEMTQGLLAPFDKRNGGWGGAPKFPQPMAVEFLLRRHVRTGDAQALHAAEFTLQKMSAGGMYDQLGGGFHRYSVDAVWLVPHFEKMLYDNALLARTYVHSLQVTGNPLYGRIAEETLGYVLREMTHESGAFYSTQDADSEGEEGRFFLWTPEQVAEVLEPDDALLFCQVFGVVPGGTFEERSILHLAKDPRDVGEAVGSSEAQVIASLATSRRRLFEAREERVRPARDEKVLTSWNGLMLAAFADAGRALGRPDFTRAAERNGEFILSNLRTPVGRLHRTWKDGRARLTGFLEDYAFVTEGLLALYQATFDERWFVAARELADIMLAHFAAPGGGFYDTADDHEELIVRPQDLQDNATPSGNAMAAGALVRLAAYTGDSRYTSAVEPLMVRMRGLLERYPLAFAQWLTAYDLAATDGGPVEVAVVGDPDAPDTMALVSVALAGYHPERVVALKRPGAPTAVPLLDGREMLPLRDRETGPVTIAARSTLGGRATAYVCRGLSCRQPVTDPAALRGQLG